MEYGFIALGGCSLLLIGLFIGLWVGRMSKPPEDEVLLEYLNRIVNMEEVEEHRRLLRLQAIRAGRNTLRFDGGPNARVMRMRINPGRKAK